MKRMAFLFAMLVTTTACGGGPKLQSLPKLPFKHAGAQPQAPAAASTAPPAMSGTAFAEVEATLVPRTDPSAPVEYRVTRVFRIVEGFLMEEGGEVTASCPSPGSDVCSYRIGKDEVLPLDLTVQESGRPNIFRSGRPSSLELAVPPGGWTRGCSCRKTSGSVQARLMGTFVGQGRPPASPALVVTGRSCNSAGSRLFMKKCAVPDLPTTARLRLSWDRGDRGVADPQSARR